VTWDLGPGLIRVTIAGVVNTLTVDGAVEDLLGDLAGLGVSTSFVDNDLLGIPAAALLPGLRLEREFERRQA
jgi:hypothetical protein